MGNGTDEHTGEGQPRSITCALFVRSPVAGDRTVVIDRLTALRAAGAIESVDIRTVPDRIHLAEVDDLRQTTEVGAAFEALVGWTGGDFAPTFDVSAGTSRTGRAVRTVQPPAITLAVYDHGELVAVVPCRDEERHVTVEECLESLETAGRLPAELEPGPSAI
jgi:hypothetical protein